MGLAASAAAAGCEEASPANRILGEPASFQGPRLSGSARGILDSVRACIYTSVIYYFATAFARRAEEYLADPVNS